MSNQKKSTFQVVVKFVGLYFAIVAFVYGLLPLGVLGFGAARCEYGSWSAATVLYDTRTWA